MTGIPSVLVIEDEHAVRAVVKLEVKAAFGGRVALMDAASKEDALGQLARVPDIVILDLCIPERSGAAIPESSNGMALLAESRRLCPAAELFIMTSVSQFDSRSLREFAKAPVRLFVKGGDLAWYSSFAREVAACLERRHTRGVSLERNLEVAPESSSRRDVIEDLLVGNCSAIQEVRTLVQRWAAAEAPILILGETGTGKELVANAVHMLSRRTGEPFQAVNCGGIPDSLMQDELFGHEKSAFTGADKNRKGLFERVDGGTLFLDEIGEMSASMQATLLRVTQGDQNIEGRLTTGWEEAREGNRRVFTRLGGDSSVSADVRLICATDRDLEKLVAEGRFSKGLYYRLNRLLITLPPLRSRGEDIALLATHFLGRLNDELGRQHVFSKQTLAEFRTYLWPGNVRELRNVIERLVYVADPRTELLEWKVSASPRRDESEADALIRAVFEGHYDLPKALERLERLIIEEALRRTDYQKGKAADILGVNRRTIWKKMNEQ